jgi:hypothetical protein
VNQTKTIHFETHDQYAATNDLLRGAGLVVDLDDFLPEHLIGVLRKQYPTTEIESIELLEIDQCSLGGMQESDSSPILVDSLSVPINVATIVTVDKQRIMLKLQVVIRVTGKNGKYTKLETDVFVLEQMSL